MRTALSLHYKKFVNNHGGRLAVIIFIIVIISCIYVVEIPSQENVVTIDVSEESGKVNRMIFGGNFIGYIPGEERRRFPYADYGGGLWNPEKMKTVSEVISLGKSAAISVARFNTNNYYVWQNTIGKNRKHFLYGVDEFLKSAEEIGAIPVFTIGYHTASAQDAAALVEYLNVPCEESKIWACRRAENGHPAPYNVKYFEIGNEIALSEYGSRYLEYYDAMKSVDASVHIGAVLIPWRARQVLEQIGNKIDFGIIHIYPKYLNTINDKNVEAMEPSTVFKLSLAVPEMLDENRLQATLELLKEKTSRNIPLAITEFNIGLAQSKPIEYRHTLGASLVVAELIRIFMKPENRILLANYHQFSNGAWGMIRSEGDFTKHDYRKPIRYVKRPNYYVFELYNRHFGEILLNTNVKVTSYDIAEYPQSQRVTLNSKRGTVAGDNLLENEWNIVNVTGIQTQEKNNLLNIEFIRPVHFNYFHSHKKAKVLPDTYYRLSGYMKTVELIDKIGVSLTISDARGWTRTKSAAETDRIVGTNDWQYVEVLYKTLPDASSVHVLVRRTGTAGPLKGRVSIKDVKLEQFIPDTHIPYLSVNASKSIDGKKVYLMVINRNLDNKVTTIIDLKHFTPSQKGYAMILNGPSVIATNEKLFDNVKVSRKRVIINKIPFRFTFEPHSLTAIELFQSVSAKDGI